MPVIPRRTALLAPLAALPGLAVSDFPDWQAPQAHATAIAATGVPLLALKTVVYNPGAQVIAAGAAITTTFLPIGQVGYEFSIKAFANSGSANPFVKIQLQWVESVSGIFTGTETFIVPAAASPKSWITVGRGPTKGDQVGITITNLDTANSMTVVPVMLQHSRVYATDSWYGLNFANSVVTVPGWILPDLPDDESVLGMLGGVSVPAGGSLTYLFGMHNGLIGVGLDQGGGPWSNIKLQIAAEPNSSYVIDNPIYAAVSPPPAIQIAGPRAPLRVILTNTATTVFTATMSMIRLD